MKTFFTLTTGLLVGLLVGAFSTITLLLTDNWTRKMMNEAAEDLK